MLARRTFPSVAIRKQWVRQTPSTFHFQAQAQWAERWAWDSRWFPSKIGPVNEQNAWWWFLLHAEPWRRTPPCTWSLGWNGFPAHRIMSDIAGTDSEDDAFSQRHQQHLFEHRYGCVLLPTATMWPSPIPNMLQRQIILKLQRCEIWYRNQHYFLTGGYVFWFEPWQSV
jgi:hypothetical protein